jgi:hypothetical protein
MKIFHKIPDIRNEQRKILKNCSGGLKRIKHIAGEIVIRILVKW